MIKRYFKYLSKHGMNDRLRLFQAVGIRPGQPVLPASGPDSGEFRNLFFQNFESGAQRQE
jgi:hypothetical protein